MRASVRSTLFLTSSVTDSWMIPTVNEGDVAMRKGEPIARPQEVSAVTSLEPSRVCEPGEYERGTGKSHEGCRQNPEQVELPAVTMVSHHLRIVADEEEDDEQGWREQSIDHGRPEEEPDGVELPGGVDLLAHPRVPRAGLGKGVRGRSGQYRNGQDSGADESEREQQIGRVT